jgi:hypothetical protein
MFAERRSKVTESVRKSTQTYTLRNRDLALRFPIPPGPARRFSTGLRSGLSNGRFYRAIKNSSFAMSMACFGSLSYRNTHTKELLSSTNGTVLEKTFKHSQRSTFSVFSPKHRHQYQESIPNHSTSATIVPTVVPWYPLF